MKTKVEILVHRHGQVGSFKRKIKYLPVDNCGPLMLTRVSISECP